MDPHDDLGHDHGPHTCDHHPIAVGDTVTAGILGALMPLRVRALHAIRSREGFILWAVDPGEGEPCVWAHDCLRDPERWRRTRVEDLTRQIHSREAELAPLRREYEALIAQAVSEGGCDA